MAYREIASENVDCEAAYAGVSEVYRAQAANASTVEEAMGCFAKEESEVAGFQYDEADLLILTEVASKDIQNANVVLDFMDTLDEIFEWEHGGYDYLIEITEKYQYNILSRKKNPNIHSNKGYKP